MKQQLSNSATQQLSNSGLKKLIVLCLLVFETILSSAQAPKVLWIRCLRPPGQSCSSPIPPVTCAQALMDHDPCDYDWYFKDEANNNVKATCCSAHGTTENIPDYIYAQNGFRYDVIAGLPIVKIKCDGEESFQEFFSMSAFISGYENPIVSFNNRNDSLVIELYEADTIEPFIKLESYSEQTFADTFITNFCLNGLPFTLFSNESEIFRRPISTVLIKENPVNGSVLKFDFLDSEVKLYLLKIEIIDINGKIIQTLNTSMIQNHVGDISINLSDLPKQILFLQVTTEFDFQNYKIALTN